MAHVKAVSVLENCLDSSVVKEFELDCPLDQELMTIMAHGGKLLFYPDFPRPYFRIEKEKHYVIQGVLGNTTFRVTFSPSAKEGVECTLRDWIEAGDRESLTL